MTNLVNPELLARLVGEGAHESRPTRFMKRLSAAFARAAIPCGALGLTASAALCESHLGDEQPRLTPYTRSADFPPKSLEADKSAVAAWYRNTFAAVPMKAAPSMTSRERELCSMSATEYVQARRRGTVQCEEYAQALIKRALHYRYLNQWIYSSYERFDRTLEQARALDRKAAAEGVEAIGPLFGLPIPMKGTAAVVDYPSGAGVGVLSGYVPVRDSALTALIKERHGLIFGSTNVPEFAASTITRNPASGTTRNVYDHALTVGGSSGGAGSAVAAYVCPLAATEDTAGSTRIPALCNGNFGFDPSRNHYPNAGNTGMSYTNDQLGVNARSVDDIILYDRCLGSSKVQAAHQAAEQSAAARPAASIRVGSPLLPWVHTVSVGDGLAPFSTRPLNADVADKYERAKAAIASAGFALVQREWRTAFFDYLRRDENVLVESLYSGRMVNGQLCGDHAVFHSFAGQVAQFVHAYLDAPVSLREVLADISPCTSPRKLLEGVGMGQEDESCFRYRLGPKIKVRPSIFRMADSRLQLTSL